jgi:hypothetical protein
LRSTTTDSESWAAIVAPRATRDQSDPSWKLARTIHA